MSKLSKTARASMRVGREITQRIEVYRLNPNRRGKAHIPHRVFSDRAEAESFVAANPGTYIFEWEGSIR